MKKFEFRLETALRLRLTQLKREKLKLQSLLFEETKLERLLLDLEAERLKASSNLQSCSTVGAFELRALSAFNLGAETRKMSLKQQLARQAQLIREARQHVMLAERNLRLLEKMRDKERAEWQTAWDRDLQANAEEAWTAGHFRPRRPE
jgi:flagellar export protein FliJ